MIKRFIAAVLSFAVLAVLPGCASILDGRIDSITPHEKPTATTGESIIEASNYIQLKDRILGFIKQREETGLIRINIYDGNIQSDVDRVCDEIINDDPYGAYAVTSMSGTESKFVSYYEVTIHIDYYKNVTKKQLSDIITVPTLRYLKSYLQDKLSSYAPSLTVLTKGIVLTEDDAIGIIKQIYYENPMAVVMLPILPAIDFYPKHGPDRIVKFTFEYRYEPSTLRAMTEALKEKVRHIAETVGGSSDGAILLSLCKNLVEVTSYDATTAGSVEYSTQNISATAYGALINASAIGEGYAMAYKALCDELGYESYVVLGTRNGKQHAWNIVELGTDYYHVDVSMCDVNGIATAFLKNDTDMRKDYKWDTSKYKACNGPITYASLASSLSSPSASPSGTPAVSPSGSPAAKPTGGPAVSAHTT